MIYFVVSWFILVFLALCSVVIREDKRNDGAYAALVVVQAQS